MNFRIKDRINFKKEISWLRNHYIWKVWPTLEVIHMELTWEKAALKWPLDPCFPSQVQNLEPRFKCNMWTRITLRITFLILVAGNLIRQPRIIVSRSTCLAVRRLRTIGSKDSRPISWRQISLIIINKFRRKLFFLKLSSRRLHFQNMMPEKFLMLFLRTQSFRSNGNIWLRIFGVRRSIDPLRMTDRN